MATPTPPAIELSDSDVLPIVSEWAPADSIPMLELSAIMEPEPKPVVEAEPVQTPRRPRPNLMTAAVASLSTSAPVPSADEPSPSESIVTWQPRSRSVGWIMGTAAAASVAVILLGWSLVPTSASAEPATQVDEPAPVVLQAEVPEPASEPAAVVAEAAPDNRATARKWATIGNRQLKAGNRATAKKMFERALEAQANNRMAHAGLGKIALQRKQPRRAVEHLRLAVKIEPRKAENRRLLGQAYMALGRRAKAQTHLEKAVAYGDARAQQLLMDL